MHEKFSAFWMKFSRVFSFEIIMIENVELSIQVSSKWQIWQKISIFTIEKFFALWITFRKLLFAKNQLQELFFNFIKVFRIWKLILKKNWGPLKYEKMTFHFFSLHIFELTQIFLRENESKPWNFRREVHLCSKIDMKNYFQRL